MSQATSNLLYLVTIICFILALRFLSSPTTARARNWVGAFGMAVAIGVTLAQHGRPHRLADPGRRGDRAAFGAVGARKVKMTAMPQMVALFNGVGGGAAALVSLAEFHILAPATGPPAQGRRDRDRPLGADRLGVVRRVDGRVREAPGADPGPADHVSRPAVREPGAVLGDRRRGIAIVAGYEQQWLLVAMILGALVFGVSSCCRSAEPTCRS